MIPIFHLFKIDKIALMDDIKKVIWHEKGTWYMYVIKSND